MDFERVRLCFQPRPRRPSSVADEAIIRAASFHPVDYEDDTSWSDIGSVAVVYITDTDSEDGETPSEDGEEGENGEDGEDGEAGQDGQDGQDGETSSDDDTPFRQSIMRVLDLANRAFVPYSDADSGVDSPSFCSRCTELGLADIYPMIHDHLERTNLIGLADESMNTVVQRLIFDLDIPYDPFCSVCGAFTGHLPSTWTVQSTDKKRWEFSWSQQDGYACYAYRTDSMGQVLPSEYFRPWADAKVISAERGYVMDLHESLDGEVNYIALRQLLDLCEEKHSQCSLAESADFHNVLLIDVVERRLVQYSGADSKYVALSYVWGGTPSVPFSRGELPLYTNRTIEDAILVVGRLGLRYLWVDAICIDQNDERHLLSQLAIMGSIYGCAYATIIASTAESAADGLSGVSSSRPSNLPVDQVSFGTNQLISAGMPFQHQKKTSPWLSRAWTFQEGLLSRRCLVWDKSDVYFICDKLQLFADRPHLQGQLLDRRQTSEFTGWFIKQAAAQDLTRSSNSSRARYDGISDIVGQYFSRLLTKESDRLRAFTGVLEEFRRTTFPEGFYLGLPKHDFQLSLGWRIGDGVQVKRNRCFQSWSWAGWQISEPASHSSRDGCHWLTSNPTLHPPLLIKNVSGEHLRCGPSPKATQHQLRLDRIEEFKRPIFDFVLNFNSELDDSKTNDMVTSLVTMSESTLDVIGVIFDYQLFQAPSWRAQTGRHGYPCGHLKISPGCYVKVLHGEEFDAPSETGPFRGSSLSSTRESYLLHGFGDGGLISRASLTLHMLQLRWENGIAYRCGWMLVEVPEAALESIYEWNPRKCRFLLG